MILVHNGVTARNIKIQEGEFFWDTDPGQGAGTSLVAFDGNFNQAIEKVFDASPVTMPSAGNRVFNIRLKDEDGNWGGWHDENRNLGQHKPTREETALMYKLFQQSYRSLKFPSFPKLPKLAHWKVDMKTDIDPSS